MLTQEQDQLLGRLEEHCLQKNNKVWVGTWADMVAIGGDRDLLNQLEQRGYIAPYMQFDDYWTVMPTRAQGMERDTVAEVEE
jgi:hypothetical protein